jgi:hypothetical protein
MALMNLCFGNFNHTTLRICHFVQQRDSATEFNDLVVCAEAKGIAHPFECANVANITLVVSCIPCCYRCPLDFRSLEQQTSVSTHELASEFQIMGQAFERINRVVREAGCAFR